ncbi:hypothetical protein GCM10009739_28630 [Microbacterium ulmi]
MIALAIVAAAGVVGTVCLTAYVGDGAHFLHRMLVEGGFAFGNADRTFSAGVTELPAIVAIAVGGVDAGAVALIYSAGLMLIPTAAWCAAILLHWRTPLLWLFFTMWAVVFPVSAFFAVGEYNLTYALVALAAALVLRTGPWTLAESIGLAAVSVVLLRSYESTIFLGPVLIVGVVLRMRDRDDVEAGRGRKRATTWIVGAAAVLLAGGAVLGLVTALWTLSPVGGGTFDQAANLSLLARDPRVVVAGVAVLAMILALAVSSRRLAIAAIGVGILAAIALLAVPIFPSAVPRVIDADWPYPWMHYNARIAVAVLLAVLIGLATALRFTRLGVRAHDRVRAAWVVPVVVIVAMGIDFGRTCVEFRDWTHDFAQTVRSRAGLIPFEASGVHPRFTWTWTNPTLSLVLWTREGQGVILNSADYDGWEPFDPHEPLPTVPARFLAQP